MHLGLVWCIVGCTGFSLLMLQMYLSSLRTQAPAQSAMAGAKQDKHLILSVGKCCYNSTEMSGDSKCLDSIRRVWEFPMFRSAETEFQDDTPKGFS